MATLLKQKHKLSDTQAQIEILSDTEHIPPFDQKLKETGLYPLKPTGIEILQVNVGKMCNQTCKHCHVDAGPDRKEIMTRETMEYCLRAVESSDIHTVDITGGAPELNPHFRWFVEQLSKLKVQIIVRCNLTIILANPRFNDLPEFFKKHKVNVVSSLPHFTSRRTDAQRGEGVFDKSIKALRMLNEVGYGIDPELQLDLVFNPSGAILPGDQNALELEFKRKLKDRHGIVFNHLFTITNLPVSRFLDYLLITDNYRDYMTELANAYNPLAAEGVMCRNMISVGWDGHLFDCDFNQMLDIRVASNKQHISNFDRAAMEDREIVVNNHCYGCTAGAGSSCGGATT
jgi:radical SAM/Cys-rich protein